MCPQPHLHPGNPREKTWEEWEQAFKQEVNFPAHHASLIMLHSLPLFCAFQGDYDQEQDTILSVISDCFTLNTRNKRPLMLLSTKMWESS